MKKAHTSPKKKKASTMADKIKQGQAKGFARLGYSTSAGSNTTPYDATAPKKLKKSPLRKKK